MATIDVAVPFDLARYEGFVVCRFERTDRPLSFICKYPKPCGPYVFVSSQHGGKSPRDDYWLTGLLKSEKKNFRQGELLASIIEIREVLARAAREVEWYKNEHGVVEPVKETIKTRFSCFEVRYDTGERSNGQDVGGAILFRPSEVSPFHKVFSALGQGSLACCDQDEIMRVERIRRAFQVHRGKLLRF